MTDPATIFGPANNAIIEDIRRELRLQGHHLTGALERSLQSIIDHTENTISLSASAAGYLQSLEESTPASKISISEAEFQGLKRWVVLRGMASLPGEATRIAAAIVRKWQKEGRPTAGSLQYSQTGKRTEAVKETFARNEAKYSTLIDSGIRTGLDAEFHNTKSGTI